MLMLDYSVAKLHVGCLKSWDMFILFFSFSDIIPLLSAII